MISRWINFWIPQEMRVEGESYRRARGLMICIFLTAPWWPFFAYNYKKMGAPDSFFYGTILFGAALFLVPVLLKTTKSILLAGNFACLVFFGTFAHNAYAGDGIYSQALINMPIVIMIAIFLVERRSGIIWALIILAYVCFLHYAEKMGVEFHGFMNEKDGLELLFNNLLALVFTATFITSYYEKINRDLYGTADARAFALEKVNKAIVSQQEKLIQNSKMVALGEMAAGVAHEVNNPLATIQITAGQLSELADEEVVNRDFIKEMLGLIESTVSRVTQVIKSLRAFSRDASKDPMVKARVSELIQSTLVVCEEKLKTNNITLKRTGDATNAFVFCQPVQLSHVFLSLLSNSFDAIGSSKERWIEISVFEKENHIEISFSDSGSGISEEVREKIFQPFFTTKEVGKGQGLGLSVARGILEKHSGKIYLDNNYKMTRFVIELPKVRA